MRKLKIKTLCLSVVSILALHSGAVFAGNINENSIVVNPNNNISDIKLDNTKIQNMQDASNVKLNNNDITKDKISDDAVTKAVSEEVNSNPYAGTPLEAEDYTQKSKILDSQISYYGKQIELQKKKDDFDLSPLRKKLAEINLNSQLMEADGYTSSKDNKEPQITEEEINRRIKYGIEKAIQQEKQSNIARQSELKQQTIKKESQFILKMISNQKDKTSAIVENGDKTYTVKNGDKIGKWDVVDISSEQEYVTIKNGKIIKKITYLERNPVINITKSISKTGEQQSSPENTMDQTLPVPPNFNN